MNRAQRLLVRRRSCFEMPGKVSFQWIPGVGVVTVPHEQLVFQVSIDAHS